MKWTQSKENRLGIFESRLGMLSVFALPRPDGWTVRVRVIGHVGLLDSFEATTLDEIQERMLRVHGGTPRG